MTGTVFGVPSRFAAGRLKAAAGRLMAAAGRPRTAGMVLRVTVPREFEPKWHWARWYNSSMVPNDATIRFSKEN